jgi:predicted dehydrogenase
LSNKINIGVIGTGHLGQYHVEKYHQHPAANLIAICDIEPQRASQLAQQYNLASFSDFRDLVSQVDAVSIVTPTPSHFTIAQSCLEQGLDVLIEKPITTSIEQADALISLAKKKQCLIQVGHIERFNPCIQALRALNCQPQFIEAIRVAPFQQRGSDVNVILDLMIHDIDIIHAICPAEIKNIQASGAAVFSPFIDMVNARIEFTNNCVANLTASRLSNKRERTFRAFQQNGYFKCDLQHRNLKHYARDTHTQSNTAEGIKLTEENFPESDALFAEISEFIYCCQTRSKPQVSGQEARRALATATKLTSLVKEQTQHHASQT